jgi:zinc transporter ZupT
MATKSTVTVDTHVGHDDHVDHDDEGMTTIMKLKIALIVILFAIVYLGLIPAYSKFCRSSKVTLSLMNCFAGGVFIAMAFIHILPESVE